jgi:hypothetical protein
MENITEGNFIPIPKITDLFGDENDPGHRKIKTIIMSGSNFVGLDKLAIGSRPVTHIPTRGCHCGKIMYGIAYEPGYEQRGKTLFMCPNPDCLETVIKSSDDHPFVINPQKRRKIITAPIADCYLLK